jgi:hypothetical protein
MTFASLNDDDGNEALAEINMIPLIDVMLVLLVIFIVTAPLLTHAVKVDLPKASSAPNLTKPDNVQARHRQCRPGVLERRGDHRAGPRRTAARGRDAVATARVAPARRTHDALRKGRRTDVRRGARRPDPHRLCNGTTIPLIFNPSQPVPGPASQIDSPTRTHHEDHPKRYRTARRPAARRRRAAGHPGRRAGSTPGVAHRQRPGRCRQARWLPRHTHTCRQGAEQDPHKIPQAVTTLTGALLEEQQVGSLKRSAAQRRRPQLQRRRRRPHRRQHEPARLLHLRRPLPRRHSRRRPVQPRDLQRTTRSTCCAAPAAMLFGRGQAGGVINQVSEVADAHRAVQAHRQHRRLRLPRIHRRPQQALQFADTALRINAMQRDEGSWRSNPASGAEPEIHRKGLAFSLALNQRGDHRFWLNHYILSTNDNPDYGISFDGTTKRPGTSSRFSPDTFWGADRTFDKSDSRITTLVHEYRISADSQLRTQLRSADYERSYWARTPSLTVAPSRQWLAVHGARHLQRRPDAHFRLRDGHAAVRLQHEIQSRRDEARVPCRRRVPEGELIPQQPAQPRRHHRRQPALVCPLRREHGGNGRALQLGFLRRLCPGHGRVHPALEGHLRTASRPDGRAVQQRHLAQAELSARTACAPRCPSIPRKTPTITSAGAIPSAPPPTSTS